MHREVCTTISACPRSAHGSAFGGTRTAAHQGAVLRFTRHASAFTR